MRAVPATVILSSFALFGCAYEEPEGCGYVPIDARGFGPIGVFYESDQDAAELEWVPWPRSGGLDLSTAEGLHLRFFVAAPAGRPVDERYWSRVEVDLTDGLTEVPGRITAATVAYGDDVARTSLDITFDLPSGEVTLTYEIDYFHATSTCLSSSDSDAADTLFGVIAAGAWLGR